LLTSLDALRRSRYDSISCYLSRDESLRPEYNDIDLVIDKDIYQTLRDRGIDELLARHIAHLFIRDPLVIYHGKIELDDEKFSDHFENIQSTNWFVFPKTFMTASKQHSFSASSQANCSVQASSPSISHRMASRVPSHGVQHY
jgi:hypothetical protein